jgi:hypothetical protein
VLTIRWVPFLLDGPRHAYGVRSAIGAQAPLLPPPTQTGEIEDRGKAEVETRRG